MRLVSSKHVVSFYGGEAISLCKTEESHIHQQISFCLSTVESYGTVSQHACYQDPETGVLKI